MPGARRGAGGGADARGRSRRRAPREDHAQRARRELRRRAAPPAPHAPGAHGTPVYLLLDC